MMKKTAKEKMRYEEYVKHRLKLLKKSLAKMSLATALNKPRKIAVRLPGKMKER